MKPNFQIIESNAGHLLAFLFNRNNKVIRGIENLEYLSHADFMLNFNALKDGDDAEDWEGQIHNPAGVYNNIRLDFGYELIADQSKTYPDKMGRAGSIAFGID